jgi:hypothetical protein
MVLAAMIGFGSAGIAPVSEAATRAELAQITVNQKGSDFKYWNEKSVPFQKLKSYVKDVTNPGSKNFIPVEDRIAVFDLDGTLVGETTPCYFEWMMYLERALNDKSFTPSPEDREYAEEVKQTIEEVGIPNPKPERTRNMPKDMDRREAISQESVFSGMTMPEYEQFVKNFMDTKAEGMTNLKRGEAYYLPMVEVVSYLRNNGFTVYMDSACEREILRCLVEGVLDVPRDKMIGSNVHYVTSKQGNDAPDHHFFDRHTEKVVRSGVFAGENGQSNKIFSIFYEIGKQPVLAFGNSTGDSGMLEYTLQNNPYPSASFFVLCDDTERELGNPAKAEKLKKLADERGWDTISMKDEFKTIYGDKVKLAKKAK